MPRKKPSQHQFMLEFWLSVLSVQQKFGKKTYRFESKKREFLTFAEPKLSLFSGKLKNFLPWNL